MKNFFATLFKWNWANIGKGTVGIAAAILTIAAIPALPFVVPVSVIAISSGVVGVGAIFGVHATHLADPPPGSGKTCLPEGVIDPKAPV